MKLFYKYVSTILFLFVISTFILSYLYLRKIEDCTCLLKRSKGESLIDIKKLQYAQLAIIIFAIIDYIFVLNDHIDKLGIYKIILLFIILTIYLYFLYNIYYFAKNMEDTECKCGGSWERYILYKQFMMYISVFIIITISLIFNIEHHLLNKLYESSYMKHIYYLIKSLFIKNNL